MACAIFEQAFSDWTRHNGVRFIRSRRTVRAIGTGCEWRIPPGLPKNWAEIETQEHAQAWLSTMCSIERFIVRYYNKRYGYEEQF